MKKILITGGDSYTDGRYGLYKQLGIKTWPELLAAKNNYDIINTATAGCSNRHIFNSVTDEIIKHLEKDIIVVVSWSEICRLSFIDDTYLDKAFFLIGDKDHNERRKVSQTMANFFDSLNPIREEIIKFLKIDETFNARLIRQTFKTMWLLQDFCYSKGIPFYHVNTFDMFEVQAEFTENYFQSIDILYESLYYNEVKNNTRYMGDKYCLCNDIDKQNLFIEYEGKLNLHPNQEGHQLISDIIDNFIKTGVKPRPNTHESNGPYRIMR